MSTHNIGFYEDLTKNIFELSSNKHLISSSEQEAHKAKLIHWALNLLHNQTENVEHFSKSLKLTLIKPSCNIKKIFFSTVLMKFRKFQKILIVMEEKDTRFLFFVSLHSKGNTI